MCQCRKENVLTISSQIPWEGSLPGTKVSKAETGTLYKLEKGKQPKAVIKGLTISNGMAFSMDEKYLFHTDSPKFTVTRYDYDVKTGNIKNPKIFYKGEEKLGYPDGITIDKEDNIWIAFWGASKVRRFSPDGKLAVEIEVPAIQPSSVILGGDKMNTLFITSACEGAKNIQTGTDDIGNFLGGNVYSVSVNISGRPEWLAEIEE
jgi:sugar lactone lactonase YvrE